jgi:hypothetical protein
MAFETKNAKAADREEVPYSGEALKKRDIDIQFYS